VSWTEARAPLQPREHQIAIEEFEHGLFFRDRLIAGDEHAGVAAP
jgi:hypothetical protein